MNRPVNKMSHMRNKLGGPAFEGAGWKRPTTNSRCATPDIIHEQSINQRAKNCESRSVTIKRAVDLFHSFYHHETPLSNFALKKLLFFTELKNILLDSFIR